MALPEAMQKMLGSQILGIAFFAMGQTGALMILNGTLHPYWLWPNLVSIFIIAVTILWLVWRGMSRTIAMTLVGGVNILCLLLMLGVMLGWTTAPAAAQAAAYAPTLMAGYDATAVMGFAGLSALAASTTLLVMAGVGVALLGSVAGLMAARMKP